MIAPTIGEQGLAAVQARKWDKAIFHLSRAIDESKSPVWLLARSQAHMESGDLDKALRDAEYAYCTALERGNDKSRKQMIDAQHRRSVVYFRSKHYANADACVAWAIDLAKGRALKMAEAHTASLVDDKGLYHATMADMADDLDVANKDMTPQASVSAIMGGTGKKHSYEKEYQRARAWRSTIIHLLESLPADDPARKITVKMTPVKPSLDDTFPKVHQHDPELEAAMALPRVVPKPASSNAPFRADIYQTDKTITVSFFMKFASKEDMAKVQIDFQPNLITITGVPREPSTAYIIPHAAIDTAKSTFRVVMMKIEVTLAKVQPGKWPSFGREELTKPDASALPKIDSIEPETTGAAPLVDTTNSKAPAYPTSSKSGPKDWEKLGADGDDEEDSQDVNSFFSKLYKDAAPEQRRAMQKSFMESNGTTLSTDWDSVGKGPVPTNPPDGMVEKKWTT